MKRKFSFFIFRFLGIMALLTGIYLLAGGVWDYIQQHQRMDWPVAEDTVTDVSGRVESSGAGSGRRSYTVYDIVYVYEVERESYFGEYNRSSVMYLVGDLLKIKYDPDEPGDSTTNLSPQLSGLLIPVGAGVLFAGMGFFLSGAFTFLRGRRKQKELPEPEELPPEEYEETKTEERVPKGRGVIFLTKILPVFLITAMVLGTYFLLSGSGAVTPEKFQKTAEDCGYEAEVSTDTLRQEWRLGSLLKAAVSVHTENIRIDFCELTTIDSARKLYRGMGLPAEGEVFETNGLKEAFYGAHGEDMYTAKVRVNSTVVYLVCRPGYEEEMMEILEKTGCPTDERYAA